MSKQTVQGYMFMEFDNDWTHADYEQKWWPRWKEYKPDENPQRVYIGEMAVEFTVPDDFDPVPRQVMALEQQKRDAMADYQRRVAEINEQLSKLQALEWKSK